MMSEALFKLVCTSVASSASLTKVLGSARATTELARESDVSGIAIFDGWRFLHYMEGAQDALRRMVGSLREDTCHQACTVLYEGPLEGPRRFSSWFPGYPLIVDGNQLARVAALSGVEILHGMDAILSSLEIG